MSKRMNPELFFGSGGNATGPTTPRHPVFSSAALEDTVPLAVYGDEGTGKRKHPC